MGRFERKAKPRRIAVLEVVGLGPRAVGPGELKEQPGVDRGREIDQRGPTPSPGPVYNFDRLFAPEGLEIDHALAGAGHDLRRRGGGSRGQRGDDPEPSERRDHV
ncbi:MAG TPA: hypothetical protein DEP35_06760 [Deltaproteobacteria bacterium]|nr:hypothetical protein [Deltaproteobacteria bacterium]